MVSSISTNTLSDHIVCAPILWITEKIKKTCETIFGYLLRIVIFQLGEMRKMGAPCIMRIYQRISSDPREEKPFDPKRLEDSKRFLIRFGGVETVVQAADGAAQIHVMTFKSSDFFAKFRELGAVPLDVLHEGRPRRVLLDPPLEDAAKFFLPIIDVRMNDGALKKGALLPESPNAHRPPHIFDCHSPGRSMCMNRRYLGTHLAAGYDVTIWDPRGTAESTGTPSEGGYYLDAETAFQTLRDQNIPYDRIYVAGFCEGASVAAHLKKKFHDRGVHFIASNPYTSIKDVIEGYGWFGKLVASFGLSAIQDPQIEVNQDYFDNLNKLRNLPRSEGKCVFIHTDTDKMMPEGTVQKLRDAFGNAGPVREILRQHPNPKENGHLQPPYEDPIVWRRYIQEVT
jgi:pimeloyl-ACP methyl ester carboxylesterase